MFLIGSSIIGGFFLGLSFRNATNTPIVTNSEKLMINVNNWRLSQGLQPYQSDNWLCDQATLRVYDVRNGISHEGLHLRYEGKYDLSENLSEGYTEDEALTAWLNSPTHSEILHKNYTHACIRCIDNKCVNLFANL